jgi:ligand-binding sensor domain-containing protein
VGGGTLDSGLIRLKDVKFKTYTPLEQFPGEILLSIYEDRQGDLWLGTAQGRSLWCQAKFFIFFCFSPSLLIYIY